MAFSLVAASGDYSVVMVPGLLVAGPLVAELLFMGIGFRWAGFSSCLLEGPVVVVSRLRAQVQYTLWCSAACGIFPIRDRTPCLLHRRG